jgi:hypothetical protein
MEKLSIRWKGHSASHLMDTFQRSSIHLFPANGRCSHRGESLDVVPANRAPDPIHFGARHELGFPNGRLHGIGGLLNVGHDITPDTTGAGLTNSEDPKLRAPTPIHHDLCNKGAGFRGSDIQTGEEMGTLTHDVPPEGGGLGCARMVAGRSRITT